MTLKDPFELAAKEEYFKLLELAAKAAGIWDETDPSNGMLKPTGQYWDPLRDDGDALRLAATLGLVVDCSNLSAALPYKRGVRWLDQTMSNMELLRRAIVFAASQIGKQQEQPK